jgi:ABC-2 type transport system ATP-binding protein
MTEAIVVDHVTKDFVLRRHKTFKQMTVAKMRGQKTVDRFNAVDDVSFTVQQGESIGLMGLNGSGKSTLLKVISGVMKPNKGTVLTRGRIAGLIATGAGFQQQLSGLENIYLNAAIYGLNEKETKAVLDEIIEFADIGQFIDQPVGAYSSGMSSRLGFAIAVHVDCDIFLADEILAVGDKPFKRKCMAKMEEIRNSGKTIVYVSHAAASVQKMCDRVIALEKGRVLFDGDVAEGIRILNYGDDDGDELGLDDAELGADV